MHDPALAIVGLGRQGALQAEAELAVDIILDQRHPMLRQQFHQRLPVLLRHQAAERILETRHEPAGLDRMAPQHLGQRVQLDPVARMGRHFDRPQVQPLKVDPATGETKGGLNA